MKLKVLGSGSSGNCYLLQSKDETLIIECGLPYKTILKGLSFDLNKVVGCLVSHEHKDHSKAFSDMLRNGVNVYVSPGTARTIADEYGYIETFHRLKFIRSEQQFQIGNFTILPFETQHDSAEPLGFLICHDDMGKLLFITDSYYCRYSFKGIKHFLIECNYSKEILDKNIENGLNQALAGRLLKSHFSLENVQKFLENTDLGKCEDIILLHLSDSNSNAKEFKKDIQMKSGKPVYIADKGLEIEF